MDLILKYNPPHHLASRGSNKLVNLSLKRRCPGSVAQGWANNLAWGALFEKAVFIGRPTI